MPPGVHAMVSLFVPSGEARTGFKQPRNDCNGWKCAAANGDEAKFDWNGRIGSRYVPGPVIRDQLYSVDPAFSSSLPKFPLVKCRSVNLPLGKSRDWHPC